MKSVAGTGGTSLLFGHLFPEKLNEIEKITGLGARAWLPLWIRQCKFSICNVKKMNFGVFYC